MDFDVWTQQQAAALAAHNPAALDWDGLQEEIEDMGKSDRREIRSRLQTLLEHLLKRAFFFSPDNVRGWNTTIRTERDGILRVLEDSPSLTRYVADSIPEAYSKARGAVTADYDGPVPPQCPWTVEELLGK